MKHSTVDLDRSSYCQRVEGRDFGRTGVLTPAQSADLAFWINQLIDSIEAGG